MTTPTLQPNSVQSDDFNRLLNIKEIYYEPAVLDYPRAQSILANYPNAQLIEVDSHWNIPELHGNEGAVEDWNRIKRTVLVLGVKKSLQARPNDRSSDFVAPSHANGCAMACGYCYVARRKGFANPITTFVNIEQITRYIKRHAAKQGNKPEPNQVDPQYWVYEIGENSDCSVDAAISDNVKDIITLFRDIPNAKATFATKRVKRELLSYDPQGKTRIRFSLMPQSKASVVDIRTSSVGDRIAAINDFVEAGYEVHVNFAPVIYYDDWLPEYEQLFEQIDDTLSNKAKEQLQAEVIFLTHNDRLHEVNLGWHPQAEKLLWRPELQETKFSQTGGRNVRYKRGFKGTLVDGLCELIRERLPYCNIRYAF
ncbi:spore photoproduct lyase family protein [Oscillatoria sp. FACHB-1407]|uniref:spore photoproduct lyase family protein n=1 Tax=Oscillatoria sp. FACHB-1407 TaxID=2692847 RepID=UPI00168608C6|nr:spore photoproduct lyase family protein [Oscillatoria sp. FACHB-1407]MBD2462450.1 spore photoproduct lyase family protein [Oscillatoria sp. FACHB-1407]